jgi:hypothetical protein
VKVKTRLPPPTGRGTRKEDRYNTLDAILFILFILSIGLVVWGINIYRRTVIEPKYLFVAVSMGTIVAAVILLFVTREFLNAFWTLFIAAIVGGGTAYFLTLYLNRELVVDKEITSDTFNIQKTGNLARGKSGSCRSPYAMIDFYGSEKRLVFYCEYEKTIHNYKKVEVEYFKGFFGFPVICKQTLVQ